MAMHDGHRARKRKQFRENGLDSFADHEVLELLLFYAIPRADTNPIAHRLIERYGSLCGVLSAPAADLEAVEGVGPSAALLLNLILPVARRARLSPHSGPVILHSAESAYAYLKDLFDSTAQEESLYELCVDAKGKLIARYHIGQGWHDAVRFNVRTIVENALRCSASGVFLAHNHPSGIALPSHGDNVGTVMVWDALHGVSIELVDHIIVADGDYVSLRQNGLLPPK